MEPIEAILFEPVGCLAEFPSNAFNEIAANVFRRPAPAGALGSASYWHVLSLMEDRGTRLSLSEWEAIQRYELDAVDRAQPFEDVIPALAELKSLGLVLIVASSLGGLATSRFLERFALDDFLSNVWSRDTSGGVKTAPLLTSVTNASLKAERVMFITDTAEGLRTATQVGVNAILMMNDPDEAMKLTAHNPAGGIVSLHELPDFVRLVSAQNAQGAQDGAQSRP